MKIAGLSGSQAGSKTRIAMNAAMNSIFENYPEVKTELIDLADYKKRVSNGRDHLDYEGDTGYVTKTLKEADAITIGNPIFQAPIPAALKNIVDLLTFNAFRDKVASMRSMIFKD